jgi:3-oxoacyl-(acyl-carrier-protein) synthase
MERTTDEINDFTDEELSLMEDGVTVDDIMKIRHKLTSPESEMTVNRYLCNIVRDTQIMPNDPKMMLNFGLMYIQECLKDIGPVAARNSSEAFGMAMQKIIEEIKGDLPLIEKSKEILISPFITIEEFKKFKALIDIFNRELIKAFIRNILETGELHFQDVIDYINHHGSSLYVKDIEELDKLAETLPGKLIYITSIKPKLKIKKLSPWKQYNAMSKSTLRDKSDNKK